MTTQTYSHKKNYFAQDRPFLIDDMDDEQIEKKSKLPRKEILQQLREKNLLGYGKTIKIKDMIEISGKSPKEIGEKEWAWVFLSFWGICESQGFFPTSRGKAGDLYLFTAEEMSFVNEKKNKTAYNKLQRRQRNLYMIPREQLNKETQKKLEFEQMRNADLILQMSNKLRERCV